MGLIGVLTLAMSLPVMATENKASKDKTPAGENKVIENKPIENETSHWMNQKSKIRHNKKCRYYGKGKNGKPCGPNDGKPCKVCGG